MLLGGAIKATVLGSNSISINNWTKPNTVRFFNDANSFLVKFIERWINQRAHNGNMLFNDLESSFGHN